MNGTNFIAIYAAVLSTIVFIWNIRSSSPRYEVDLVIGIEEVDGKMVSGIHVSIKNPSTRTVHISNVSLLYRYRHAKWHEYFIDALKYKRFPSNIGWVHSALSNYEIEDGCPIAIEPGKSHGILIQEKILEEIFEGSVDRRIKCVAQDQLWRNKYSSALEFPVPIVDDEDT